MIILTASKSCLTASRRELLVEGAVNVNIVQFVFSSDWDGLTKTAVFQAGSDKYSVLLNESNEAPIPWEVLQNPHRTLYAGVYGTNGESLVLPTIWTSLGIIQEGANPGQDTQPPTPDVYSQILQVAKDAEDVAQSVRDDADSGKFNGEQGPTGPQGYTYTPAVSEEGVISWTNDGSLPNPSPVNIKGPQGKQGIQGVQGKQGERGYVYTPNVSQDGIISWTNDGGLENPGPVDIRGPVGPQGGQGEQGIQGPRGYTYTPSVGEDGTVSWTNDGNLPNPDPVNITGPQGETGETPDITAGTVETLEPGQDATAEITGETPNLVLNLGIPKGQPGQDAPQIDDDVVSATNPWSSQKIVDTLAPPFEVSGAIVTCNPVAGYPLHVVSQIMPVQEGTGDPSPDNVRPISGRESVTVTRCGRNVMPQQEKVAAYHGVSITWHGDGSVSIFGQSTKTFYIVGPHFYAPKGTYYAYINQSATKLGIQYSGNKYINKQITMDGIAPCRYVVNFDEGDTVDETIYTMLSAGAKAPEKWESYQGNDYALTLPETIYGGTVDAVTGEGSEEWKLVEFDGTETWSKYAGATEDGMIVFVIVIPDAALGYQTSICNQFKNVSGAWNRDIPWAYSDDTTVPNKYFCVQTSEFPDVDSWKSYLAAQYAAGTPVQVCYKLATPQPIQATGGQTIPALSGANTIYTDGDSVTVSGRADPNAVINNLAQRIAALEEQAING